MKYQGLKDVELTRTASENTHVTGADRQPTRAVQPTETKYYLNPQGQIVDVGGDWDKFAWKGQAFEATADFVIGKYLADFIEGFETVSYLNAILFVSRRSTTPFQMLTRCDFGTTLRILRMEITGVENNLVRVAHTLVMERSFQELGHEAKIRDPNIGTRCSMCCNQLSNGKWVNPLADRQRRYIATGYTVCPDCKVRARSALERMQSPVNLLDEALNAKPRFGKTG